MWTEGASQQTQENRGLLPLRKRSSGDMGYRIFSLSLCTLYTIFDDLSSGSAAQRALQATLFSFFAAIG